MGFGRSPLPENARSKSDEQLAWVQYGHALKESENLREAEDAYRKALALKPKVADTHLQLGHALKLQGHKQAAAAAHLHEAGRNDVVTATDIGEQILKQVAVAPLVRHVMLGIDNR